MEVIDSRQNGVLSVLSQAGTSDPTDALRAFIVQACGLDAKAVRRRWIQKPATRPQLSEDWASVGITEIVTTGTHSEIGTRGNDDEIDSQYITLVSHQTLRGIATFYGANAMQLADTFRDAACTSQNNDWLASNYGIVFQSIDDSIVSNPEFIFEQWVSRYDVRFAIGRRVERVVGVRNIGSFDGIEIYTDKGQL